MNDVDNWYPFWHIDWDKLTVIEKLIYHELDPEKYEMPVEIIHVSGKAIK